ncbi:MAG: 6-pyruvoyl-tetrahydropterin synthase-related protein [Candidatus Promineifilaceae bacterium]|nr:6-pyruvoyl-tetrahydropterin synthase-related protein [Candidatus Promineifilaceae bacterium]
MDLLTTNGQQEDRSSPWYARLWAQLGLVGLLGLPLITPLLRWTSEPCTHDGHLHFHRVAALSHAWSNGLYFSRWLPDVAFGYGYPFFIFREAVPLYLALSGHLLGLPLAASFNLFYALCIMAGGLFMFLWVRDLFGGLPAVVGAVAYMAAPYVLLDALERGNQPESLALALLPFLGWAGRRFMARGRRRDFLPAVLGLALLGLSHNISILLFAPFLFLYLLLVGWLRQLAWRTVLLRLGLLFGLGLALTVFYTGPALLELDQITISQSVTTRNNDFHFNFVSLGEVLAPATPADPTLINPPLPIRLGWLPVALALLGLVSVAFLRSHQARGQLIFMAVAAAAYLFMASPPAVGVWESLPLIRFVQFPWRMVGRAAMPVAFLAAAPFAVLIQRRPQLGRGWGLPALAGLAVGLLLLEALPALYPPFCTTVPYPTIADVHRYEHETGLVGVDPEGSYFPRTVAVRPEGSPLEADYQTGRPPQRFDNAALPPNAAVLSASYRPTAAHLVVDTPRPFQARYLSFAYPGWTVSVNGQPVDIVPSQPEGLITFRVPAGRNTVEVAWRATPLRAGLTVVSLLALGVTAAVFVLLGRPGWPDDLLPGRPTLRRPEPRAYGVILLVGLGVLAFKLGAVDRLETPLRRAAAPTVQQPGGLQAGELRLEGYNLSRDTVAAGASFDIDLAWRTLAPPTADYQSNVWLVGPDGLGWSDKETARPRLYEDATATRFWLPGQWAWDSREVTVLPGTPPGVYDIVLTLFDLADLQPLTLRSADGAALGPTAVIGQIAVTRPAEPPALAPQFPLDGTAAGQQLLGYSQDRQQAAPGEELLLTLFWQATDATGPERVPLRLVDESDQVVHQWRLPLVRADYPPRAWAVGQRLRGQHLLRLPAALSSGRYSFFLADRPLGQVLINAPERRFDQPPVDQPLDASFAARARLVGYALTPAQPGPGDTLTVTLVWQALAEMTQSYRVFVHALDENGAIVSQSDAEPAGWTRPTTGWVADEYVLDSHRLLLAPELDAVPGRLRVGLYNADDRQRLPVDGSAGDVEWVIIDLTP